MLFVSAKNLFKGQGIIKKLIKTLKKVKVKNKVHC